MSLAAYEKDVLVSEDEIDDSTLDEFEDYDDAEEEDAYPLPATDASLNAEGEELDDTTLKTEGARSRLIGLLDWSVDATINWEPGDDAFDMIRKAFFDRDSVYVYYLPEGVGSAEGGYKGEVKIQNFGHDGAVGDIESIDLSLPSGGSLDIIEP